MVTWDSQQSTLISESLVPHLENWVEFADTLLIRFNRFKTAELCKMGNLLRQFRGLII